MKLKLNLPEDTAPVKLIKTIEKEKFVIDSWLESQPSQSMLLVNWDELLSDCDNQLESINEFLNGQLIIQKSKKIMFHYNY